MVKIIFSILLILAQLFPGVFSDNFYKEKVSYDSGIINVSKLPYIKKSHDDASVKLNGVSSLVYDCKNNEIVFARNTDERVAPASLTKLLTALTAIKYMPIDTVLTVGSEIDLVKRGSSVAYLRKKDRIRLDNLLYGLLLPSGCDAAHTIAASTARYVTGFEMNDKEAIEFFVVLMNDTARKIGMKSSNFTTPDGYDDERQYVTAEDMLVLACSAYNNSVIREVIKYRKKEVTFESGRSVTWESTNLMLNPDDIYYYENICGMKTGSSDMAGKSFIGVYDDARYSFITIVLGCDEYFIRYIDTHRLITYAKSHS